MAQPTKIDGSKPWAVFQWHFMTVVQHNYWMPNEKASYLIADLNEPAAHILHGIPTGAMYVQVTEALGNRYSDRHLKAAFHSQLRRKTHYVEEFLQEFAIAIDHLAHSNHAELPEKLISKEANRLKKCDIR
jgi:hypothetical protein